MLETINNQNKRLTPMLAPLDLKTLASPVSLAFTGRLIKLPRGQPPYWIRGAALAGRATRPRPSDPPAKGRKDACRPVRGCQQTLKLTCEYLLWLT